jgi:hypothetical protein
MLANGHLPIVSQSRQKRTSSIAPRVVGARFQPWSNRLEGAALNEAATANKEFRLPTFTITSDIWWVVL